MTAGVCRVEPGGVEGTAGRYVSLENVRLYR